jgi:hypothetical protein
MISIQGVQPQYLIQPAANIPLSSLSVINGSISTRYI